MGDQNQQTFEPVGEDTLYGNGGYADPNGGAQQQPQGLVRKQCPGYVRVLFVEVECLWPVCSSFIFGLVTFVGFYLPVCHLMLFLFASIIIRGPLEYSLMHTFPSPSPSPSTCWVYTLCLKNNIQLPGLADMHIGFGYAYFTDIAGDSDRLLPLPITY